MCKKIEDTCFQLGLECIRIPQSMHSKQDAGSRHMDGIRYSFEKRGFAHNGIVVMIDADMFLVKPFSIIQYMNGLDLVAEKQERFDGKNRITYIAPLLVFLNMQTLPNKHSISFQGGYIEGQACDVGAHMYYYFNNNPTIKKALYLNQSSYHLPKDHLQLAQAGYDDIAIAFIQKLHSTGYTIEFHLNNTFIHHYAGGSNWTHDSQKYLAEKAQLINEFIDASLRKYAAA